MFDTIASRTARVQGFETSPGCVAMVVLSPLVSDEPTWVRPLDDLRPWNADIETD